jgi:hypothetical protein
MLICVDRSAPTGSKLTFRSLINTGELHFHMLLSLLIASLEPLISLQRPYFGDARRQQ